MVTAQRQPLTAAQQGIWLGQQLDPHSPAYWTAEVVELRGALDDAAFEAALCQAVSECDALHQRYRAEGENIWQALHPQEWSLARLRLDQAAARCWMNSDLQHVPDLAHGPLFASALITVGPQRTLWYLRVHHIALDGFGYTLLAARVAALYSSITANGALPPARLCALAPVVEEDAQYHASPACEADRQFWCARMAGSLPALLAPATPAARHVARVRGQCSHDWLGLVTATGTDWPSLMVAACAAWLHRESGARELVLGLPVMSRLGSRSLTVPCMAMNIVPLRLCVDPATSLVSLAQLAAAEMRAVRPHQRYRYEHLKAQLGMAGGRRRLFGAVVNLMPFDRPLAFGSLAARSHPLAAGPVEDLSITIAPHPGGMRCDLEANGEAYAHARVQALHSRLMQGLQALADAPHAPIAQVLGQHKLAVIEPVAPALAPQPVLTLLQRHALATPEVPALEQDGETICYAGLLHQVQSLAGRLRAAGITEESRVALLLPREPRTIVAMLAVLWAGGGYIPLDPGGPAVRLQGVLKDSTPQLVITLVQHAALAGKIPVFCLDQPAPAAAPMPVPAPVAESALAYVIYTSGSTGRPNGVMIERASLAQFVAAASARYAISAGDRMLQFAPLHFDASIEEIYLPLCAGATVVLRNKAMMDSLPAFLVACAERRISILDLPTAFWHELAFCVGQSQAALPACVRLVIIGGEAAQAARVRQWLRAAPHATLLNTYGPTETTVICTTAALTDTDGAPPIGRPLGGIGIAVVDRHMRPVPAGQEGELCLSGPQLARGYLGRPELTAQRFITLAALTGARAYRSGDRVVLGEDGQLCYLGRLDGELKISGQRIDPLEIEEALLAFPGVREAAVVSAGDRQLAAFIAPQLNLRTAALRAFLAERLAPAAIPATFLQQTALPRNHNGKIDRAALRMEAGRQAPEIPAGASLQATVARIWAEALGVHAVEPDDDFFALGGTSLTAIQVANRLGVALQREVPVSSLFRHATVAALAQALGALSGHAPPAGSSEFAHLLEIQKGAGPALFCIHPAEGLAWCYLGLSRHLPHMAIHGLQARGLSAALPRDIQAMVEDYLATIRRTQATGPYYLLGWSSGGGLAHELAVRLRAQGESVGLLAMMDAYPSDIWHGKPPAGERDALLAILDVIGADAVDEAGNPLARDAMLARLRHRGSTLAGASDAQLARMTETALHTMQLYRRLRHGRYDGDLLFFHAAERGPDAPDWRGWAPYVGGRIDRIDVACSHNTMSRPAPLAHIGRTLAQRLAHQPTP
ncbi:amino acid adenylation domain-containing protein [Massilia sp. PAMC28688]|uniref:non-ribosomal peptide synthetase n=1 Tax=Massilia sp. PAMC28688 TaxID=2861283 RepID=UPI001C62E711|nr:non-ribosomal peptide synthetase [Massilia sp. PAMC28688]QYF95650.1 amino acid adenylation domain-containing protein [Massilia sp. PAMC28688]